MLVLLPPSEGKAIPARGRPVDLDALAFPELREQREALLTPELLAAPAAPAHQVYTGVLYGRLRLGELPAAARRRVLIFSALWGVLRPNDRIPHYKLPITPQLAAHWRAALAATLPATGLIVDCRSGAYVTAWRPGRALAVRAFTEAADGSRKPVSHMAKAARGDLARAALLASPMPRRAADVAAAGESAGLRVELADGALSVIT